MSVPDDLERALRRAQLLTAFARRMAALGCTCDRAESAPRLGDPWLCPSCDARSTLAQLPPLEPPTYTRGTAPRPR